MFLQTPRQEIAGNYLQLLHFGGLLCFQEEDWFAYIDTEDRNTLLSCQGVCVCVCVYVHSGQLSCFAKSEHNKLSTICSPLECDAPLEAAVV